jgi:S-adenosylmethionine:tRNA ribosyltransferase-isomerase
VAQEPAAERSASRLMWLPRQDGPPGHHVFRDLPRLLRAGDLLVVNRSRVFPARLLGRRPTGAAIELLLLRALPGPGDEWECYVRPARRVPAGSAVALADGFSAHVLSGALEPDGRRRIRLSAQGRTVEDAIATHGHVPLPPYVRRPDHPADRERYQTVYAREAGSVAAPTAGLHFTPELMAELVARGIGIAEIVLHVGPGTFKPVTAEEVEEHRVDPEHFVVPAETAEAFASCRARGGRVVAVGTTSTRTLESALDAAGRLQPGPGETALFIRPGHVFRAVDGLVTNFHLPRSSLLMLVSALGGRERVLDAYRIAVGERYRFYSYGDAMLVL